MVVSSRRAGSLLSQRASWQRYALTLLACVVTTLLAAPLADVLDLTNIALLFLLTVLLVAVSLGMDAALMSAVTSVAAFDFFFVPPRFSFEVQNAQYLVTLVVMLVVAVVTGRLAAGLRSQADASAAEEARARALSAMARDLSAALLLEQVVEITRGFLHRTLNADVTLLLADRAGALAVLPGDEARFRIEPRLARMAYEEGKPIECDPLAGVGCAVLYLPLLAPMRVRGVIAVFPEDSLSSELALERPRMEAMASLVAIAVERIHYVDVAQRTQVQMVSERLRSSILSALSHDLRTPLTALVGLADSLTVSRPPLSPDALETAEAIRDQAERMASLVGNLLDMARLHAGEVSLHKEWQPIEEVIGSSVKILGRALAGHRVRVSLADGLPLVEIDAVLMERVFCNLIENAAKYAPPGTVIEILVCARDTALEVRVCDAGPGFPKGAEGAVFDMFVRGNPESSRPGVGLGLAICSAIIEAHEGTIDAANRPEGGACVRFTVPLGTPPVVEEEALPAEEDAS